MKRVAISLCIIFVSQLSFGQISDSVATAIRCLLLDKYVSEKIFFDYKNEWRGPGYLPDGNYAFICPDTTYQKVHKGILTLFPYAPDGYLYKIKFYKDSVRSIYVNGTINFELAIVFKKIFVKDDVAHINFFTTSTRNQERFKSRYVSVDGHLRYLQGQWKLEKCKLKPIDWIDFFKWPDNHSIRRRQ